MTIDYVVKIEIDSIKDVQFFQWAGYRLIRDTLNDIFDKPKIQWNFGPYNAAYAYKALLRIQTDIPSDVTEEEVKELIKLVVESYSDELIPPTVTFLKIPETFSNQDFFQMFIF